ncbi:MAG: hypothetical protein JSU01_03850 [Bacteroidetes bacterium]|nr:hypothetical protein [Bacteroidota bacterium]
MRKIVITLVLLAAGSTISLAQCDKKIKMTSSQTQYLDANGNVERTVDENDTFEISPSNVKIVVNGNDAMSGTISSNTCDWKVPFKEGKTIINTRLEDQSGDVKEAVLTIEGKDGKVTLLAQLVSMPDKKIRIAIEKFEELTENTSK